MSRRLIQRIVGIAALVTAFAAITSIAVVWFGLAHIDDPSVPMPSDALIRIARVTWPGVALVPFLTLGWWVLKIGRRPNSN